MATDNLNDSGNEMVGNTLNNVSNAAQQPNLMGQQNVGDIQSTPSNPQEGLQPSNETQKKADNPSTAWIGGVKKESYEKGVNFGYAKALEDLKNNLNEQPNQNNYAYNQSNPIDETHMTQNNHSQNTSQKPSFDANEIAQQAAQINQMKQMEDQYSRIGMEAQMRYGEDYTSKANEYIQNIQNLNSQSDMRCKHLANQMQQAIHECVKRGPEMTYKLFSDDNFRNDLLGGNPLFWQQKLASYQNNAPMNAVEMASQIVKGSPNSDGTNRSHTSYGKKVERTWDERRKAVKNN